MLAEKYRPRDWSEYVGQERAAKMARRIIERDGFDRGAFWIDCAGANNSGTGKTSLAWLIARALADDFFVCELDGDKLDKAAVHRMEAEAQLSTWCADRPFRVWIVNEAHAMTSGAVDALLPFLERLPQHCAVILTTTREVSDLFGEDAGPFASRCYRIRLTNQGLADAFAERVRTIAQAEGLDGLPVSEYVKLARRCKNNMRMMLREVESGAMLDA